jgi:hypothetical protein
LETPEIQIGYLGEHGVRGWFETIRSYPRERKTPPPFDIRGVGNKRSDGWWPGEGSWPSPQSPKGFSAFLPLTRRPIARGKPKYLHENKGASESPEV